MVQPYADYSRSRFGARIFVNKYKQITELIQISLAKAMRIKVTLICCT